MTKENKMKKTLLIWSAVCFVISVIFMSYIVYAQEIQFSAHVEQGSLYQSTNFSTLEVIDNSNYIQGRYQNKLYAPIVDSIDYTYDFSGQADTSLSATSSFPVPIIKNDERIGVTQANKTTQDCGQVAAGSQIAVNSISNFQTSASPGGAGACLGVNYSVSADKAQGMMAFGYAEHKTGLMVMTTPAEKEGEDDTVTTIFGKTNVSFEVAARGEINDFIVAATGPQCSPAGEFPTDFFDPFVLCVGQPTGLSPWEITP